MVDPTTVNKLLAVPTRGSNVGTWDVPVNADWMALDDLLGGALTLGLSSATTITLTTGTGSVTPGAGPTQSDNALIKFTGTLSGNSVIRLTLPGFYIIDNRCTVGTSYVQLSPSSGTGNSIGAIPGKKMWVFFDGTDVDFVGMPDPGTYLDLAVATTPAWMSACTVPPYLLCNGAVYTASIFPQLAAQLGSTFGGNGITTFGVPDQQNRARVPIGAGGGIRLTSGTAGIDGSVFGAAGGDQNLQEHDHGLTTILAGALNVGAQSGANFSIAANVSAFFRTDDQGSGESGNVQPTMVHGLTFIKT